MCWAVSTEGKCAGVAGPHGSFFGGLVFARRGFSIVFVFGPGLSYRLAWRHWLGLGSSGALGRVKTTESQKL